MELVTGAMGSLLPKLAELLKEEYGLQKDLRKKIRSLSGELEAVHAVLRKIGDVPPDQLDEQVRIWARVVREASYDMEDIVDAFLLRVDDDDHEPTDDPSMLRRLRRKMGGLFKKSKARRKIFCLIQDVKEKLDEVAARRGRYSLDSIVAKPVAATATIDPRLLNLYKRATELVGIDGPRDELINKLSLGGDGVDLSNKRMMKVVSVVGFGGMGKTTLAKTVYDHLKPRFEHSAFLPVGRNPDVKKMFRDTIIGLDIGKYTNSDLMVLDEKQLMDELKEFVEQRRCLIIIDDIWDKESWKLIRCALQDGNSRSRVVMTTRISEVAAHADEVYKIQPLSRANSEKLLYARIADGEGKFFDSPPAEACDKILKKCGGVPLAIITIGSLLASKPGKYWYEVYNLIGFGHGGNDDVDNTRKILSFSYYDLSAHLKPCLLYLSVFLEDQVIQKNSLIWKWIAEGFIDEEQAEGAETLFERGERYFNELINRSMIQPVEKDEGYVDGCRVHDMVFDLVRSLSNQENFITVLDGHERQKLLPGNTVRRLALQRINKEHDGGQQLASNVALDKVRSLVVSECDFGLSSCPRIPVLRVLDMEGNEGILDHLVRSSVHLRYLRLANISSRGLPREVRYLRFLQVLDLSESGLRELPEEVGLLTQLVCLRAGWEFLRAIPDGWIGNLTSLLELWICPSAAIAMRFLEELGMLRELRVLRTYIVVRSESMEKALLECLSNLDKIQELRIEGGSPDLRRGTRHHAGHVSCRHLHYLRLDCFLFSGLPTWINSSVAPNLSCLMLDVLGVKEQDMETLARLPKLCCLRLNSHQYTRLVSIDVRAGHFGRLRILTILGTPVWFDLRCCVAAASAAMPGLESLEFEVDVRSLKDSALLSSDGLLGFENLGKNSLQSVTVEVNCRGARTSEVEEVEAALERMAAAHPKRPALYTRRVAQDDMVMVSSYQEACMDVSRTPDFVIKAWKFADIVDSGQIRLLCMPDPAASSSKVTRLLYTNNGEALIALTSSAVHKLWKWRRSGRNPRGKSTTSETPQLWQPKKGVLMTNDTNGGNPEEATACSALSQNDGYLISASGGKVSLFNFATFEIMTTFMTPPPAATFISFYPQDNNIIAIGMEDSSIRIYNVRLYEVKMELMGHQSKITGLAFSQSMNVLVSSGADAQLCVWSIHGWEKKKSRYIQPPSSASDAFVGDTTVQFHSDQTSILVVHESHLAIYDANLECLHSWSPGDVLPSPVSSAVYSSDGLMIYGAFRDGAIGIFEAESLKLHCRIAPSAYVPSSISSGGGGIVYPMAVAANPWKRNQIAVGMSDGAVHVLEPLEN